MKQNSLWISWPSQVALVVKKRPSCPCGRCQRREFSLQVGKIPWGGYSNPLQRSCLENPMDRGAWRIPRIEEPGESHGQRSLENPMDRGPGESHGQRAWRIPWIEGLENPMDRGPGESHGQRSLANLMDRGAWRIPWIAGPGGPQAVVSEQGTTEATQHTCVCQLKQF